MLNLDWTTVSALIAISTLYSGLVLLALNIMSGRNQAANQRMMDAQKEYFDSAVSSFRNTLERLSSDCNTNEKNLLRLEALLPQQYVRRDDWIRFSSVIDHKQDSIREELSETNRHLERVSQQIASLPCKGENSCTN